MSRVDGGSNFKTVKKSCKRLHDVNAIKTRIDNERGQVKGTLEFCQNYNQGIAKINLRLDWAWEEDWQIWQRKLSTSSAETGLWEQQRWISQLRRQSLFCRLYVSAWRLCNWRKSMWLGCTFKRKQGAAKVLDAGGKWIPRTLWNTDTLWLVQTFVDAANSPRTFCFRSNLDMELMLISCSTFKADRVLCVCLASEYCMSILGSITAFLKYIDVINLWSYENAGFTIGLSTLYSKTYQKNSTKNFPLWESAPHRCFLIFFPGALTS